MKVFKNEDGTEVTQDEQMVDPSNMTPEQKDGLILQLYAMLQNAGDTVVKSGVIENFKTCGVYTAQRRLGMIAIDSLHNKIIMPNLPAGLALMLSTSSKSNTVAKFFEACAFATALPLLKVKAPAGLHNTMDILAQAATIASLEQAQEFFSVDKLMNALLTPEAMVQIELIKSADNNGN